jgi:peroxiredoxin Q/BCP
VLLLHQKFAKQFKLPFILLSDSDKKIEKLLVFPPECSVASGRVTYVTDKNGVVQMILTVCWLQNIFPKRWKLLKN